VFITQLMYVASFRFRDVETEDWVLRLRIILWSVRGALAYQSRGLPEAAALQVRRNVSEVLDRTTPSPFMVDDASALQTMLDFISADVDTLLENTPGRCFIIQQYVDPNEIHVRETALAKLERIHVNIAAYMESMRCTPEYLQITYPTFAMVMYERRDTTDPTPDRRLVGMYRDPTRVEYVFFDIDFALVEIDKLRAMGFTSFNRIPIRVVHPDVMHDLLDMYETLRACDQTAAEVIHNREPGMNDTPENNTTLSTIDEIAIRSDVIIKRPSLVRTHRPRSSTPSQKVMRISTATRYGTNEMGDTTPTKEVAFNVPTRERGRLVRLVWYNNALRDGLVYN
jgi:hypothetical protein